MKTLRSNKLHKDSGIENTEAVERNINKCGKRKSSGLVMFDEIDEPSSSNVNASKKKRNNVTCHTTAKRKASSEQISGDDVLDKQVPSSKIKTANSRKVTNAKFCEAGQEMQMTVDDTEDDLFDTESSSDEEDPEVTFHATDSQSENSESEHEDGQIEEDRTDHSPEHIFRRW